MSDETEVQEVEPVVAAEPVVEPEPVAEPVVAEAEGFTHFSDCAVHNEPAYPAGPCSCYSRDIPTIQAELSLAVHTAAADTVELLSVELKGAIGWFKSKGAEFEQAVKDAEAHLASIL